MVNNYKKHLAVVEDDPDLLDLLKEMLEAEGYSVSAYGDALPLLRYVREKGLPHLVLIDLGLPSMHGFELSSRLKALGDVPIIIISTQNEIDTVVEGLVHYADDYVVKPFDVRELVARIQRVLSRIPNFDYTQTPVVRIDNWLSIDFGNSRLLVGDRSVVLTPIEATILHILVRNAGQVVATDTLLARVWPDQEVYEETLRVHMHRLRRKLEHDHHHPQYIQTAHGSGYCFVKEDPECIKPIDTFSDRQNLVNKPSKA